MHDLESLIDRFEDAWQRGTPPDVADFLPPDWPAPERRHALSELVHIDLEYRLKAGEPVSANSYTERFPELAEDADLVRGLAAWEQELRQRTARPGDGQATACWTEGEAPPRPEAPPPPPGPVAFAGHYRVLRRHARGGLGEILLARDESLGREVALKLLRPGQADLPDSQRRFLREAEVTSQLEHPGVVPVYGLGRAADGRPVYAMRFVHGETLREAAARFHADTRGLRTRKGMVEFRHLLSRFLHVCNTLAYAHSRGVLHRDLKPDNVMLGDFGETLVVDWGLAKHLHEADKEEPGDHPSGGEEDATRIGTVIGTPAYMSPEQAAGRWDRVGPSSDLYGLGATLYYLLTGQPPVTGPVGEVLERVARGDIPPPEERNPRVPPALAAVCRKAMARDPRQRYASALELAADLEHWLADEPVSAWREPWRVKARRWVGRHFTVVATGCVALLAAAVVTAVSVWLLGARDRERSARELAQVRNAETQRQLARVDQENYFHRIAAADQAWWGNRLSRAGKLLDLCPADLRDWEWHYLTRRNEGARHTLRGHEEEAWAVAYHPRGEWLASAGLDGTVRLWHPEKGEPGPVLRGPHARVWGLAFHPGGELLAAGGTGTDVTLWDVGSGKVRGTIPTEGWVVLGLQFHPQGRFLAIACDGRRGGPQPPGDGAVLIADLETRKVVLTLPGHEGAVEDVAFRPDGAQVASGGQDGNVKLWEVGPALERITRGEQAKPPAVRTLTLHPAAVHSVAYAPDGKRLASASRDMTVQLWDSRTGKPVRTLLGHRHDVWGVAFSPDGRQVASSSDDQTVRLWDTALGRALHVLRGHRKGIANVAFDPRGRFLASASDDRTVRIWDISDRQSCIPLCGHGASVWGVAFSPDRERLVSSGDDSMIRVWDLKRREEAHRLQGSAASACVAIHPGGLLASGHDDGSVVVWDANSGARRHTLTGHTDRVWALAFHPKNGLLVSGSWDGTVRVWDPASGKELHTLRAHEGKVWAVAFDPEGKSLATGGDDRAIHFWDPVTFQKARTLGGHVSKVVSLAFSPDGRRLAAGTGTTARVITNEPGEVRVWEVATGKELLTLRGHSGTVTGLAYHPAGRRLASGSSDGTVKVWEADTGRELVTLHGHRGPVHAVAFDPTGRWLASVSQDGLVLVWDGTP